MESIANLATEQINQNSLTIDQMNSLEIVTLMNKEEQTVALAVEQALPFIAKAVDLITASLSQGGRLFYVGAGTSGRLGILDASECPPTFGTDPSMVQALIAGGDAALVNAMEGAEDDFLAGKEDLQKVQLTNKDIIVGISASGRTPFAAGALTYAHEIGAATVALSCNRPAEISSLADVAIEVQTGPEVLTGSTRLKAGTATKMILNILSTATMVRLGKAYNNLMIDMRPTNIKLVDRACRILMEASGCDMETASSTLKAANNQLKLALVMIMTGLTADQAKSRLDAAGGFVRTAIEG